MKKDNIINITILIALLLGMFHGRQYVYSHRIEPLVRCTFCLLYPIGVLISKRKFIPLFFVIFSFPLCWLNSFNNYTSFVIIMLSSYFYGKYNKQLVIFYAINECVALIYQGCVISHLVIHFLNCFCIYYMFKIFKETVNVKPLKLTKTEIYILREMLEGKVPKEIDKYSTNTVYKAIQEAKKRNNCISTSELLFRFKETITYY